MKTTAIVTLIWFLGWTALCLAISGCAYTVSADGSRSLAIDGVQAARAIEIFGSK